MSDRVMIGGIGNVLLGDDAIGPYVVRLLESLCIFPDNVEIADLGTPALDLTHHIAGMRAVILVDCVASNEYPPGTVLLYHKCDILRVQPAQRLDPHSPALSECLMTAEMLGESPEHMTVVGIVGECFEAGSPLSQAVEQAAKNSISSILSVLARIGISYETKQSISSPSIWWSDGPACA